MTAIGDIRNGYKTSDHRHIWAACPQCGKERWVVLSKGQPKYQLCTQCAKPIGSKNPNWRGGRSKQPSGYMLIWVPNHPKAHNNYVREHILVWEETHHQPLPDGWLIHHLNGVRDDNRPENLIGMPRKKHGGNTFIKALQATIRELEGKIAAVR